MKSLNYDKWSDEEINLLKKMFIDEQKTKLEISKILNRSYLSIKNKLKKLKLLCTKEQIYKSKSLAFSGEKNGMYGKTGWSKNQTKATNDILKKSSEKISKTRKEMYKNGELPDLSGENNPMYGAIPWCKGLTKDNNDILKKSSEKISKVQKEYWKNLSKDIKDERVKKLILELQKTLKIFKNTSIELKIKNYLITELYLIDDIDFIQNYYQNRFLYDFYLPKYNLVIECQGDYYHANPNKFDHNNLNNMQKSNIDRDKRKLDYLIYNNINYLFFWETDINHNFHKVKEQIEKSICKR